MTEPFRGFIFFRTGLFNLLSFFLPFCFVFLFSCAHFSPAPEGDDQIATLEKQIKEVNKKLDDINHRVSIIQFMVDNQERMIRDHEKAEIHKNYQQNKTLVQKEPASSLNKPTDIVQKKLSDPVHNLEPQPDSNQPEIPEKLYNKAMTLYKKANYDNAAKVFVAFFEKYPDHELADNALYWTGECYYSRNNFSAAIIYFRKVIERYPEGSKVPDALLKTGYSYLAMDDRENGRFFLKKAVAGFPFSPAGSKAEEMLKRIN